MTVMSPRLKKLIGALVLPLAIAVYALAAIVVADFVPKAWPVQLAYFVIAGVAWAFPLKSLIRWMHAEPRR